MWRERDLHGSLPVNQTVSGFEKSIDWGAGPHPFRRVPGELGSAPIRNDSEAGRVGLCSQHAEVSPIHGPIASQIAPSARRHPLPVLP